MHLNQPTRHMRGPCQLQLCYFVAAILLCALGAAAVRIGVTHAAGSCDPTGNAAATARALSLLANGVKYQNQMTYGMKIFSPH